MTSFYQRLQARFVAQVTFSRDYSPLYAALFGQAAAWMTAESAAEDPLVQWLVETGQVRQTLDVTLLLAAGLHKDVLAGVQEAADLAQYFPTAGGQREVDDAFGPTLRQTILDRQETLTPFIQTKTVQTNETGRGLCWLLPLLAMPWQEVCLVDLGASAGLNLLADKRAFRLVDEETAEPLLDIGEAPPVQFISRCQGNLTPLARYEARKLPGIVGRIGCDLYPFALDTAESEQTLMSYIWGDQVARMERLREGISAFRENLSGDVPIQLHSVDLPGGLADFLRTAVPADETPVVIYNTFMTTYLSDKGESFKETIGRWASTRNQPTLWLQWEPLRGLDSGHSKYGWCAWTADLWHGSDHDRWRLAQVHPHGTEIMLSRDFSRWPPGPRSKFYSPPLLP